MTDYNPQKTIVIVGYPRSGNTWLARLIAEALDSPVSRFKDALPLGVEGGNRKGDWFVTQLHLRVNHANHNGSAIASAWDFNVNAWKGEKIVLVFRDPRDVAISARHYWDLSSNREALECMVNGSGVLAGVGKWIEFYVPWYELLTIERFDAALHVSYEGLYLSPAMYLNSIMENLGIILSHKKIEETVVNQEFSNKKNQIASEAFGGTTNERPYGKSVQLKAMRVGTPFQWMNEMSDEDNNYAIQNFGEVMEWMGYQTI